MTVMVGAEHSAAARKTRLPAAKRGHDGEGAVRSHQARMPLGCIESRLASNNLDKSIQSGLTGQRGNHIEVQHAGVVVSAAMEFASNRLDG
jgi:hypothetical protein